MSAWRLLTEDAVSPAHGLATDHVCAHRAGLGTSPTTLRLYTYAPCALVGRFQTLESELHLAACEAGGIGVNRRPTGGGAIVMGPDQLGVAWTLRGADQDGYAQARDMMVRFSKGLLLGLAELGVHAQFRGKNDLEVDGRKLAGLGVYRDKSGGVLFHGSILVGLDVPWMLSLLNTPFEKIDDKAIAAVSGRVTTVRRVTGRSVSIDDMRDALVSGFSQAFEAELRPGALTDDELSDIADRRRETYDDPAWIRRRVAMPDAFGSHKVKTPAGLVEIRATLAGPTFKAVFIGGDFFASEAALAHLEGSLRWHTTRAESLDETLRGVWARYQDGLSGLPREAVLDAILKAAKAAGGEYGCFVNPSGDAPTAEGSAAHAE